jgi:hypothetical protein
MSQWSGSPTGALLCPEERWLVAVGLLWAPFTGTYTSLCHSAGAPAVMWVGSGLMTLYGLWLAVLAPLWTRWRRARQTYEVDGGGLRVLGPRAGEVHRLVTHDIARAWLEDAPGKTRQLWVRTRGGFTELLFVGIAAGSEDDLTLRALVGELNREA